MLNCRRLTDQHALEQTFGGPIAPTKRGRDAIVAALTYAQIRPDDHVCVMTTSGSRCISPCVRWALGRWKWGHAPEQDTRAVLLIHEWGIPHPDTATIAALCNKHGWTLIEDCAHALGTAVWKSTVGRYGAWAVYSLPKFLGLPSGGLLRGPAEWTGAAFPKSWGNVLGNWVQDIEHLALARRARWEALVNAAVPFGGSSVLPLPSNAVPWKLPMRVPRVQTLSLAARRHGWDVETCLHTWSVLLPGAPSMAPNAQELAEVLASCSTKADLPGAQLHSMNSRATARWMACNDADLTCEEKSSVRFSGLSARSGTPPSDDGPTVG